MLVARADRRGATPREGMEAEVTAGLNTKNCRIKKFVEAGARYLDLPVSGDPPPFGFILNRDSSAPLGGDRNCAGRVGPSDSNSGHPMSALPPKADIGEGIAECPLLTQTGHTGCSYDTFSQFFLSGS